jgi:hypothetical protein
MLDTGIGVGVSVGWWGLCVGGRSRLGLRWRHEWRKVSRDAGLRREWTGGPDWSDFREVLGEAVLASMLVLDFKWEGLGHGRYVVVESEVMFT